MRDCRSQATAVVLCAVTMIVASCGPSGDRRPPSVPDIVSRNKGNVIVALLGMEGCPGTEKATLFLSEFSKTKPDGVVVCRVDVPLRGRSLRKADNVSSNINYTIDNDRKSAAWFDFFFYPTLYIVDKDGVVRFTGGCEPEEVKAMVAEILSEAPCVKKKMYTLPLAKAGEVIPDFRIAGADNKEVSLGALCATNGAILFFSTTTCGFSISALDDLEKLKQDFKKKFGCVIVSFGQDAETARDVYSNKSPGTIVVIDADKSVSRKHFGVSAVPFFYVLNKDRTVIGCGPFVYGSAKAALHRAFGTGRGTGCGAAQSTGGG